MPMRHESRICTQVNESELLWQGFLADEDSYEVVPKFERATESAARGDENIVAEAKGQYRTIITSNGRDFVGHIKEYQRRDDNNRCRDLWGLLVIPNGKEIRGRTLSNVIQGVEVSGIGRLDWRAIGFLNLRVRVTDSGQVEVSRFKRCQYCQGTADLRIKEPWADWYAGLPVV